MRIFKLGEKVYASSLSNVHSSYFCGFPQRERQLFSRMRDIFVDNFCVEGVRTLEGVRNTFIDFSAIDYLLLDNPLLYNLVPDSYQGVVIWDLCDYFQEMYLKEYGIDEGYWLLGLAISRLLKRSDIVIGQSPVIIDWVKKLGLRNDSRTVVVLNGYDETVFTDENIDSLLDVSLLDKKIVESVRDNIKVVFVGKLGKWYSGLFNICLAIQNLSCTSFVLVGDGVLREDLEKYSNVYVTGLVNPRVVLEYMKWADILVFPVNDCSPIVVFEYIRMKKPVVHIKGRISWLLKNMDNAILVDDTPLAWELGIKEALRNKDKLVQGIQKFDIESFSWKKQAFILETFLLQELK